MTLRSLSLRQKMLSGSALAACASGVIAFAIAAPAEAAGIIVLSGDATITNALTGNSTPVNSGNQRFFDNLLGSGNRVLIQVGGNSAPQDLFQYFNAKAGVTATFQNGEVTSANLSGVSMYVSIESPLPYTSAEISLLAAFSSGGGSLLVLGEGGGNVETNANLNALLVGLNSSLRLGNDGLDTGFHTISGNRILANPLTSGVTSFTYASTNSVTGGTGLFTTSTEQNFVAAENIGVSAAPEPAPYALLLIGLMPLTGAVIRKRRNAKAGPVN